MKHKIFKITALLTLVFVFNVGFVLAETLPPAGGGTNTLPPAGGGTNDTTHIIKLGNPIKANNVQQLLLSVVDIAIFIGTIVAVLVFIAIGFKFVMAQGNEGEITKAKEWLLTAVIGTAILLSSKIIVEVIKNTLVSAGVVDSKTFTLPQ